MSAIKLIVNADDLGLSKGVNLGIIEAHRSGIVTSTTLMVNMGEVQHALSLLQDHPRLGVGIHLVLTAGKPVCSHVPSLTRPDGYFLSQTELAKNADLEEIKREFTCQIERFFSLGLKPTHIDSHHHVHSDPRVLPVVLELAKVYGLPVRGVDREKLDYGEIKTTAYFTSEFYGENLSCEDLIELLLAASRHETGEIMVHPAYADRQLMKSSKYNLQRTCELDALTDSRLQQVLTDNNIELVNYKSI